jgi:hypothetical protein
MRHHIKTLFISSLIFMSSCSDESSRTNGKLEGFLTEAPSTTISSIAPTTAVVQDPSTSLRDLVERSKVAFSTPIIKHSCGTFALIHTDAEPTILKWDRGEWTGAIFNFATVFDPEIAVEQHWIADVTNDNDSDIILNWFYDGGNRSFGQVIYANTDDCIWRYATLVDGCGDSETIDNLTFVSDVELQGSGSINCYGARTGFKLEWYPDAEVFVTAPIDGAKYCNGLTESFDLPLSACAQGWAVQMAQESLVERGAQIDRDGQFGPATLLAVLKHQRSLDLPLTGQLDGPTWASLVSAGSEEFPDFDGDGVSSPREIGHASGAFEIYEDGSGTKTPTSPQVTVTRTYCEERRTALTSDMRGPLIEYRLITEYSNGRTKTEVVGTSWSNLSGKCP